MRKLKVIETDRGIMVANDDGSICEGFSEYSVTHKNYNFFVVDKNLEKVDSTHHEARALFYIAEQANKAVDLVKSGVQLDLALNKLDTEGLSGAINFAVDCEELEHIPEINEHLNQLPNNLIATVNEPLKAKEKQIAGVKSIKNSHRAKTVVEAIKIVKVIAEESNTLKSEAEIYRSAGLDKKKVQRAKKIVKKVSNVRKYWHTFRETMPYNNMVSTIADKTGVHLTNVEEWISEFKANNSDYLY